MELGMIGLGRMGSNMVRRLLRDGHRCVVYDLNPEAGRELEKEGAMNAGSIAELVGALRAPRAVWIMVPAGEATDETVHAVASKLEPGDAIVDGGNSYFKDDVRRARDLGTLGIHYLDVGTSGGVWGLARGYCLMIGGSNEAAARLEPVFRSLAPGRGATAPVAGGPESTAPEGYLHCGPAGAGHFAKMIHNGIEYGLMQAYAEGFDILRNASSPNLAAGHRYELDLPALAELWRRGSVIGSWLLDHTAAALAQDAALSTYTGHVEDSGEGRWTVLAALEEAVSAEVLSASLYARFRSRREHTFAEKVLSAMRRSFGGHTEPSRPAPQALLETAP
jgi:6-phosphogluconate dehydrogenase